MSKADQKIISWILKGSVEYNKVSREIDLNLLHEALLPAYKGLFKIIKEYFENYKAPPPYKILTEDLIDDMEMAMLVETVKGTDCEIAEVGFYLDRIKKRYNRYLAKVLSESVEGAEEIDVEEFNTGLIRIASKVERLRSSAVFSEGSVGGSTNDRRGDYRQVVENPGEISGVFTGYKEIDDYVYGIKNSEMMTISGASSSGKSMLMMNIAINAWLGSNSPLDPDLTAFYEDGKNVVYFTLEMSKRQLEQRLDARLAEVRHKALSRGFMGEDESWRWNQSLGFQEVYDHFRKFHIVDMPRGSKTLDVEARYDAILSEFQPDLVCVDYLGIMRPNRDHGSDWLEVGNVAADLHEFCRNKDIPTITAAQRKTKDRKSKKEYNGIEDVGRSKMIGDNTNILLLIGNREEEHLREDMEVYIAKNRDGAKGRILLQKDFERSTVRSYPAGWAEDLGEENEA
jgi:replicative DNA helicase